MKTLYLSIPRLLPVSYLVFEYLCKFCLCISLFSINMNAFHCSFQEEASAIKAAGKAWYNTMVSDSDYTEFDNFSKWLGVSQ